jgi:hypothetical protein
MMFMMDTRGAAQETMKNPSDNFLDSMRVENMPLEKAMGMAVANMLILLTENAKNQGYEYDSDVVLGAADEIVKLAYLLADSAGVIKQGPKKLEEGGTEPEYMGTLEDLAAEDELVNEQLAQSTGYLDEAEPEGEGLLDRIDYDFSHEEIQFLDLVGMEVAQYMGNHLLKTEQLDTQGFKELGQRMVMGEYNRGELDQQDIGFDDMAGSVSDESILGSMGVPPNG